MSLELPDGLYPLQNGDLEIILSRDDFSLKNFYCRGSSSTRIVIRRQGLAKSPIIIGLRGDPPFQLAKMISSLSCLAFCAIISA